MKPATSKTSKTANPVRKKAGTSSKLEDVYRQYILPMPTERWSMIENLSQPSLLKRVPTKTAYSSAE